MRDPGGTSHERKWKSWEASMKCQEGIEQLQKAGKQPPAGDLASGFSL